MDSEDLLVKLNSIRSSIGGTVADYRAGVLNLPRFLCLVSLLFQWCCTIEDKIDCANRVVEVGFVPLLRSSNHYICAILIA